MFMKLTSQVYATNRSSTKAFEREGCSKTDTLFYLQYEPYERGVSFKTSRNTKVYANFVTIGNLIYVTINNRI